MAGAGRDHIVSVPPFYPFILIAQIVLAIIVFGLAVYGATLHVWFSGNGYAFCVRILRNPIHMPNTTRSIAALIINGYYVVSTFAVPAIYNCWVFLILECLHVAWWLAWWADLAAWASAYGNSAYGITAYSLPKACYLDAGLDVVCEDAKKHKNAIAAAAGVGALLWYVLRFLPSPTVLSEQKLTSPDFLQQSSWPSLLSMSMVAVLRAHRTRWVLPSAPRRRTRKVMLAKRGLVPSRRLRVIQ